jgi:hypothetical protein
MEAKVQTPRPECSAANRQHKYYMHDAAHSLHMKLPAAEAQTVISALIPHAPNNALGTSCETSNAIVVVIVQKPVSAALLDWPHMQHWCSKM